MATGIQQSVTLRGLALPALRSRGGYFASRSPHDVAFGDLLLALFCPIGGRWMNRLFGSGLLRLLFEPNFVELAATAEAVIQDTAQKWTPHVVVDRVDVSRDHRALFLRIAFHLTSDAAVVSRLAEVPLGGSIQTLSAQHQ